MFKQIPIYFLLCFLFCSWAQAQERAKLFDTVEDQPVPAVKHWNKYFRLGVTVYRCSDGLHIKTVDPEGPASQLVPMTDRTSRATLEVDDHITHVDGVRVNSVDELIFRLGQNDGQVILTVLDKNTKQSFDYSADTRQTGAVPLAPQKSLPGKVRALVIGLTDDPKLSESIVKSVKELKHAFVNGLPENELDLHILDGAECNARSILTKIDDIDAATNDSFVVFYLGHGAYDTRYAGNDPSGGHYLQIPSGDLLRRTITNRMLAKRCRLTIFISDTCNVEYQTNNIFQYQVKTYSMTQEHCLPLQSLFHFHAGFLDLSGSGRDEFGWFHPAYGGFYTHSLLAKFPAANRWDELLSESKRRTIDLYQERRRIAMASLDSSSETYQYMKKQLAQTPTAFQNTIRELDVPRTGRTFTFSYSDGELFETRK